MDLEFRGTAEERRTQAEVVLMQMHRDLYGNGTPGLLSKMVYFMTKHDELEVERERVQRERHEANTLRLDEIAEKTGKKSLMVSVATLSVAVASVAVAILAIWVMVKLANHSSVDIYHMFSQTPSVLAIDSAIPKVR